MSICIGRRRYPRGKDSDLQCEQAGNHSMWLRNGDAICCSHSSFLFGEDTVTSIIQAHIYNNLCTSRNLNRFVQEVVHVREEIYRKFESKKVSLLPDQLKKGRILPPAPLRPADIGRTDQGGEQERKISHAQHKHSGDFLIQACRQDQSVRSMTPRGGRCLMNMEH